MAKSTDTWYVSYELPSRPAPLGRRPYSRKTITFQSEIDAKDFAKAKLRDVRSVNAGTLNPHHPKQIITSKRIVEWVEEPQNQITIEVADSNK